MKRYRESMLDNAQSLDQFIGLFTDKDVANYNLDVTREALLKLAKDIVEQEEDNKALGLSKEELAFYHAISKPENISDFYTDEELIKFTQDLTETIGNEMTPDWMMRESGRANMRRKVKRLLSKYKYPRDERDKIIDLIIEQAEYYDGMMGA